MKRAILALAVLAALTLFAVPALAAPPQLKVTWDGSGVTDADASFSKLYVQGDPIHFAGHAMLTADGTWKIRGSFEGTLHGEPIRIRPKTDETGYLHVRGDGTYMPVFDGLADVTYKGTTYRDLPFYQTFDEHLNGFQYFQIIIVGLDACVWHGWYISGIDKITDGFVEYRNSL